MSYVGYYQDSKENVLKVAERVNGKRILQEFPLILEYYVPDSNGYYTGYDGKRLKKITLSNTYQIKRHKEECLKNNIKTYELSFNIPNKVLYEQYKDQKPPVLHKSFTDIEVDRKGYEYLTIKELVDKACCPINAISIYNDWQETLYTLMLCPETLKFEEAKEICNKFDNTFLFKEEQDLLKGIIGLFDDTDVATGWNFCVNKNTPIWLTNKIVDIKDTYDGLKLYDSQIVKKSDITVKDEYKVKTILGNTIYSSQDHIFPVSVIDNEKYISKSLLDDTISDKTVKEIMDLQHSNKSCFVKICRRKNTNNDLTYRDYILNSLDWVLDTYDLCFDDFDIKNDYSKSRSKQKCYSRIKNLITKEDIKSYINTHSKIKVFSNGYCGNFTINLDEVISGDFLHILGLLYTDGSFDKNEMIFYNSNKAVIDKVSVVFDLLKTRHTNKLNPYKLYKGVYRRRLTKNNKLGFLLSFIVNNSKLLNKSLLSMLSYKQFMHFFSGCIDGDGCLSNNRVSFCNYINDNSKLQELLLWNGIISTVNNDLTNLCVKKCENAILKKDMYLWVDYKSNLLKSLDESCIKNTYSKAIQTNIKDYGDDIFVRLNDILPTNNKVEMIDICTDTHYFYANGIKTHNCFFDTPYIVRRIEKILGEDETKKLCLFNQLPKYKEKEGKFGDKNITYEIIGKWFVDYMELYIKHEQGRKESYSLNSIAEIELKEQKVQHAESLEDMYRYNYEDFIKYNRQDTMLVYRIDKKKNYINLHNAQAHDICCSLDQTMGTVGWVDQAIINEAHLNGVIVPDRVEGKNPEFTGIVPPGAYCAEPVIKGLVNHIFSFDMNSLYPTTIRSLNLSPETIFGQIQLSMTIPYLWNKIETNNLWKNVSLKKPDWGAAWGGMWSVLEYDEIMKQSETILTLKLESGDLVDISAKEIYELVFNPNNHLCISACGTIYRTDKSGLIATILGKWYSERKKLKKELFKYESMASGVEVENNDLLSSLKCISLNYVQNDNKEYDFAKLKELIKNKDINAICEMMSENHLYIEENRIMSKFKEYFEEKQMYYDLAQYVKKIQLNSSYGALLNSSSTFYDFRMGSSTTLSGRKVVQHLTSKANEILCGVYSDKGYCAEYNDTDSVYCYIDNDYFKKANPNFEFTKDNIIEYSDKVADKINDSFPLYMKQTFNCTEECANLQKAAKEIVATRGLYVSKKRYAALVYEHDGFRKDVEGSSGEMKIMGLQVKRSDCPQLVRNLLKDMLKSLLENGDKQQLLDILKEFGENKWQLLKPWEKGTPKACNKLTYYTENYFKTGKCSVGQVMAAINWNMLIDMNNDKLTPKILDGDKIIVCKLKPNNAFGMTSIAFPVDLTIFPQWFKSLPFDEQSMKDSVIDNTIDTIFGVLGWKLTLENAMNSNNDLEGFLSYV